jgi:hypothetical protein
MKIRMVQVSRVFVLSGTILLVTAAQGRAETAEALLQKINQLPAKERPAALVQGAKKEGVVVWYAGMNQANLREFTAAFESQYPFLKVKPLTIGGTRLFNRALAEYRAGKHEYDVINVRSSRLHSLKKVKAVMRYKTPHRQDLKAGFYDEDGSSMAFGHPCWFFFTTPSSCLALKCPAPWTPCSNPSGEGKWPWMTMPTIGWRRFWSITERKKGSRWPNGLATRICK